MDKVIERQTHVTIKDEDGNVLMARSLLPKGTKISQDKNGNIDVVTESGQTLWHSYNAEKITIDVENEKDAHRATIGGNE